MLTDLKYALRKLRKSPGFTLTAMVTLALGIGANAVVFSMLNALVLQPLNVPQGRNLRTIEYVENGQDMHESYPEYRDLLERNSAFSGILAYDMEPAGLDTGGNPSSVWLYEASGTYFDVLGIRPYLGRFFHPSDEHGPNSAPLVVLSYDYWHGNFHADPGVVGRTVRLNQHPFTVIGVAPPAFRGTELFFAPALWIPLVDQPMLEGWDGLSSRGTRAFSLVGRLKAGITPAPASANLNTLAAYLAKTYPKEEAGGSFRLARPGLIGDMLGRPVRAFMTGLMLLAGLILLAACANLGSLFAARAEDRSREIAVRMALGSRHGRLLRQLLTEAIVVSLGGAAAGLIGSVAILHWLSNWQPIPQFPVNVPVYPDIWTYIVALLLALASALLFGTVPVRQVLRADPWQTIRLGASGVSRLRRLTLRDFLLAAQIAICAVLVTSSLVAIRGLARSLHSNFGFQPQHAMIVAADLAMAGYTNDTTPIMQRRMLDATAAIPGVTSVGLAEQLPLALGWNDSYVFTDATTDYRPSHVAADALQYNVSPGYFPAAGTPLLAGRALNWDDKKKTPLVAVVNEEFARKLFGSPQKAIGAHFKIWAGKRVEVIGIAVDGKYKTLTEEPQPAMFFSVLQQPSKETTLIVRSNRSTQEMAAALQHTLRGLDPGLPFTVGTWDKLMSAALFPARVATIALGVLGLLAAMLAVTGLFGMASYVVSKRLRELGIRVALGAQQREVLRAALVRPFTLLVVGSAMGMLLGVLATRVLAYIVYQATPRDPLVLGGVILTMLLLGLLAAWIPARRALAVDPMILLREE
jgi:predicted permease